MVEGQGLGCRARCEISNLNPSSLYPHNPGLIVKVPVWRLGIGAKYPYLSQRSLDSCPWLCRIVLVARPGFTKLAHPHLQVTLELSCYGAVASSSRVPLMGSGQTVGGDL